MISEKELIRLLQSGNESQNLSAIVEIKESGKPAILPVLIELANSTGHDSVRNEIFGLLGQLKSNESVSFLVEAIRDDKFLPIRKKLVETCWQNGLDYSSFLSDFIGLVINGTDEISFEAFTVIDNLEYLPSEEIINNLVVRLESELPGVGETRRYFLQETIKIITQKSGF